MTDSQVEADPIYLELLEYKKANSVRDPVTTDERKIRLLLRGGHTIDNVSVADVNATNTPCLRWQKRKIGLRIVHSSHL